MDDTKYSVILKRPQDFQPIKIAEAIAKAKRIPVHDAMNVARACWGILEEKISSTEAGALVSALASQGIEAAAPPGSLVEELPKLTLVQSCSIEPSCLRLGKGELEGQTLPWDQISLVASAGYKQTTTKKLSASNGPGMKEKLIGIGITLATGIPVRIGGNTPATKTVETTDLVFYADLLAASPFGRLRIDAQNFNYSCLNARMGYNALGNFKLLVTEIAQRATKAIANQGTRIILESRPIREMGYQSLVDLEKECRWLTTLRALQLA